MVLSTQSAAKLAEQCIARFDQTLELPGLANNQWAENRRADFSLWVDGVGAQARRHASLDARLESREHELALIKTILLNLKSYLRRCLIAAEGKQLREAKLDVDAAIDSLALIAVAIRRTGQKSRLSRADRSFDRTTLVELEMHLTCMALLRRTSPEEEPPKHHEDEALSVSGENLPEHLKWHVANPAWWQSEIEGALTPLQDRLIEANLLRRNRFLYAQRHSKKLAIPQAPAKKPAASPPVPDREEVSFPTPIEAKHRQVPDNDVRETEKFLASAPMSSTRASDIDSNLNLEEPRITFQAPKTQITSITGATEYPKLRKQPVGKSGERDIEQRKIQKCPCCCEALPRGAVASKNAWKKHLSADVRPYTCISEECPSPLVLYSTRSEWEDHMKKEHPKKWKCQLCDSTESSLFSRFDLLVEHVRQEHMDSFLEEDLEAVQLWPSTFTIGLDTCPLCRSAGPLDDPTLVDHVLEHTHEFALLSLPWADLPTETFQGLATSEFFDLRCLKPVEPIFLSSLMTSSQNDGHGSEEHCMLNSDVERAISEELAVQTVQSPMLTWLNGLDMPEPKEREGSDDVLDKFKDFRMANSSSGKDDHFSRNPYFASGSEASTQDAQRDSSPSSSARVEEVPVNQIRDHGESFYYEDFPPQRRRIPDPEKWTQADELIFEIRRALRAAKVCYDFDTSKNFIPRSKLAEIVTPQKVLELVHGLECFKYPVYEQQQQIAQDICFGTIDQRPSLKVLGALIASKQEGDLYRHIKCGLTDGCLPLRENKSDNDCYLYCQCSNLNHTAVLNGPHASADDRERFAIWTRKFIAPYIRYQLGLHRHYVFETGTCLPIKPGELIRRRWTSTGQDGRDDADLGEIFRVKIYDCHCHFEDNGLRNSQGYYAVKKLTSRKRESFDLELSSLLFSDDDSRSREHMIQVLATFEQVDPSKNRSTYFLLFNYAEGDLETFWHFNKSLVGDASHCPWMAEQFLGLGKALKNVHKDRQMLRLRDDVDYPKDLYRQHMYIKPSNILYFRPREVKPLLVLAGFGLGRLHIEAVPSAQRDPDMSYFLLTYRSPEFDLPSGLVGPKSDVYSLGCVLLEFITWFLYGDILERFSQDRMQIGIDGCLQDTFFTIESSEQRTAVMKPAVKRWIEKLKEHEACSWYLIQMLELIETKMLHGDKDKRIGAAALVKELEKLKRTCERTPSLYTEDFFHSKFALDGAGH